MPRDINQNIDRQFSKTGVYLQKDTLERSGRYVSSVQNSLKQSDGSGSVSDDANATIAPSFGRLAPSIEALGASIKQHVIRDTDVQTVPLQVWEGRVVSVDLESQTMEVFLSSTLGGYEAHTGDIDLQWVSEQDKDLVIPGAVFYLTLFKRSKRGTVENSQELRFRRQPNWSKPQLALISKGADALLAKMGTPRSL
jgi:hypothetical protein